MRGMNTKAPPATAAAAPPAAASPHQLHIFRAGRHTASCGRTMDFSAADLAAAAAAYSPDVHEAPIVIGHPTHDAPAWGWVRGLQATAEGLTATTTELDAQFAEMVQAGRFKKISASFYLPDAPTNPTPGRLYLRHVGFLGAQPPALKGLRPVEFADAADALIVNFEDAASAPEPTPAPTPNPSNPSNSSPATPATSAAADGAASAAVHVASSAELAAQNAQLLQRIAALEAAAAAAAAREHHAANAAFAEGLVQRGQLPAAQRSTALAVLNAAQSLGTATTVDFGEGRPAQGLHAALRQLLSALPASVSFGEFATCERAASPAPDNPLIADAQRRFQSATRTAP